MKKFFLHIELLFLLVCTQLQAQNKSLLAPPTPNFTMVSMAGDTFNLYTELDAGKVILLDFFGISCPTCQQNNPKLDSIWQVYGYGGDSLWVCGIETSSFDSNYVANIDTFEANYGGQFPVFSTFQNTDSVLTLYNITWTPQYYIINPLTKIISPRLEITELDSVIQTTFQQMNTGQNLFEKENTEINILPSEITVSGLNDSFVKVRLISLNGKIILDKNLPLENGTGTILVNELKTGLYIVNITGQTQTLSKIFYNR